MREYFSILNGIKDSMAFSLAHIPSSIEVQNYSSRTLVKNERNLPGLQQWHFEDTRLWKYKWFGFFCTKPGEEYSN